MPERPNILFLTHRVPYPPNRGDRIRSWNMLRFLAERANIHLACLSDEPTSESSYRELEHVCQQSAIQPLSKLGRWGQGAWSLLTGKSATEGMFKSSHLQSIVRQWGRETQFDAVLVFCSSMYQFATCPELTDVRTVVDLVDVDSEKWLNYAKSASFGKKPLYHLEAKRVRQLEKTIANQADAVTLVSEEEAKVLRQFCDADNVYAISNGVDLDYFHPAPQSLKFTMDDSNKPFKLVFVGVLDYRANIEGLHWFCQQVWPQLRERIPNIELDLVGRRPGEAARQLANLPGINLVGEVEDVRPYVWRADIVIAPLTIARGIQNKVLEAMAMGKPIIATPQAVEGTGAISDQDLISVERPKDWVSEVYRLFTNRMESDQLSQAGRAYVEQNKAWQVQLKSLLDLLSPNSDSKRNTLHEVSLTS